ncbi:MAG TPA: NAD-dependent epimerase/dehydratase family protein [Steroidobacteraceae bacterium]|nr:NAD-dependent epimerase/dehydratase family protein [Steroidobacteraceae bacterium]
MRILIIGGSGFMGSHIVDTFLRHEHDVTVYDLHPEQFRRTPERSSLVVGNFGNAGALDDLIATGFDVVIHCVSTTTPKTSNESPIFDVQSNVVGTLNLLDICVAHKVGKVVFMSSGGTIYGAIGDLPKVDELRAPNPMCSYAVSKVAIEHYLEVYKHLRGLDYVSLRVSNPYGERQNPLRALGALTVFLHRTIRRQEIEVWGDGSVTRDFIYVGDVAHAVYLAAASSISGIFNVGSGVGLSLRDILSKISEVTGLEPTVRWLPARAFDVPRIVLDTSKLRNSTSWHCRTSLSDGIAKTADWLRDTRI